MIEFLIAIIGDFLYMSSYYLFAFVLWIVRRIINRPLTFQECIDKVTWK
jgi:hypothetical protein